MSSLVTGIDELITEYQRLKESVMSMHKANSRLRNDLFTAEQVIRDLKEKLAIRKHTTEEFFNGRE